MAVQTVSDTATDEAGAVARTTKAKADEITTHAGDAAGNVADSAKQQVGAVAEHAAAQGQKLADQAQQQLAAEADRQASTLADNVRSLADELHAMARAGSQGSALQTLLGQLGDKSESLAATLEEQGPDGLLRQAQDYGRRKPGSFLLSAIAAGFATTRLAKHANKASDGAAATDVYPAAPSGR